MTTHPLFQRIGPFTWLVLQAASVVAGILLAFAIDAWWGQRLENDEKNALLKALWEDMLTFNQDLLGQRVYRLASRESTLVLLRAIAIGRYEDYRFVGRPPGCSYCRSPGIWQLRPPAFRPGIGARAYI